MKDILESSRIKEVCGRRLLLLKRFFSQSSKRMGKGVSNFENGFGLFFCGSINALAEAVFDIPIKSLQGYMADNALWRLSC